MIDALLVVSSLPQLVLNLLLRCNVSGSHTFHRADAQVKGAPELNWHLGLLELTLLVREAVTKAGLELVTCLAISMSRGSAILEVACRRMHDDVVMRTGRQPSVKRHGSWWFPRVFTHNLQDDIRCVEQQLAAGVKLRISLAALGALSAMEVERLLEMRCEVADNCDQSLVLELCGPARFELVQAKFGHRVHDLLALRGSLINCGIRWELDLKHVRPRHCLRWIAQGPTG
jgi:hypothetical protein